VSDKERSELAANESPEGVGIDMTTQQDLARYRTNYHDEADSALWRARTLAFLARRFGASFVPPTLTGAERQDVNGYARQPKSRGTRLRVEESSHARLLETIASGTRGGVEGNVLGQLEGRHRSAGGNALRAAVLGTNDGLVSNLSLIMGVARANCPLSYSMRSKCVH